MPAGEICIVELDKDSSGKLLERLAQRAFYFAADVDACRQLGRRRRREPEAMRASVVVEAELQVFKCQWRRRAQPIFPEDRRIADPDLLLTKHPAGECRIAIAFCLDAGNRDTAIGLTAHMQDRALEGEHGKHHLAMPQAAPGKHCLNLLK